MSIVPQSGRSAGLAPAVRTFMFWILMVFLAVVLWQMVSKNRPSDRGSKLSYSDFMNQVDHNNIQSAEVGIAQTTADVSGKLKQPAAAYRSTVPRDTLTSLLDKLRQEGVDVQVSEQKTGAANFILGIAPIILLVVLWFYMMRVQMRQKSNPPNQPTSGALG